MCMSYSKKSKKVPKTVKTKQAVSDPEPSCALRIPPATANRAMTTLRTITVRCIRV